MRFDPLLLLPIYLPIILGVVARRTGYFSAGFAPALRQFVLKITIPFLVFMNMSSLDTDLLAQVLPLTLSLPVWMALLWLAAVGMSLLPVFRKHRFESILSMTFFNVGYIGWAVCDVALGPDGLVRSLMFTTLYWPGIFIVAFATHLAIDRTGKGMAHALGAMKNSIPVLIAFALGLTLALLEIPVPEVLAGPLSSFGSMTSPLILFGVGLTVTFRADWRQVGLLLPLRLASGLGTALLTLLLFPGLDELSRRVILIVSVMPVGASAMIIGDIMHLDEEWISGSIALSTLLALITIPISLVFLG